MVISSSTTSVCACGLCWSPHLEYVGYCLVWCEGYNVALSSWYGIFLGKDKKWALMIASLRLFCCFWKDGNCWDSLRIEALYLYGKLVFSQFTSRHKVSFLWKMRTMEEHIILWRNLWVQMTWEGGVMRASSVDW